MSPLFPPCLRVIFAAAAFLLLLFVLPSWVLAQGKLGRVRKQVHKVEASVERPSEKSGAKSEKSNAKIENIRNEVRGKQRPEKRRRPSRRYGYNPPHATAPVVVFRRTHDRFPAISFAEPVIVAERPVVEPAVSQVIGLPVSLADPVPVEYEVVSEIDQVGLDWFAAANSRIWATAGSDFDGMFIGSLGGNLQIPRFLGIDTSLAFLRERGVDWRDHLWLGDANVVYQIINLPRLKTRVGVGANFIGDRWGTDSGVNLTAGVDLKLNQRWTVAAEGDVGTLGDADFSHLKAALNRRFQGSSAEWTIGYEQYAIGDVKIDSTFTGLQIRF